MSRPNRIRIPRATIELTIIALQLGSSLPRKTKGSTPLDDTLPATAAEVERKLEAFVPKTPVPKGANRVLVNRAVRGVLTRERSVKDATAFLSPSERAYALALVDEITDWAGAQGFVVPA